MPTNALLSQRNQAFLGQALELLRGMPASLYAARPAHFERGGVGAHLRHVLDHYDAFLDGLDSGRIDYDARERDPRTEIDIEVARARLQHTITRLAATFSRADIAAGGAERKIEVAMDLGGRPSGNPSSSVSSLGRELQYMLAHTVHHFALIAVALRFAGHEPGPDFGVAPSTLRHEVEVNQAACAR